MVKVPGLPVSLPGVPGLSDLVAAIQAQTHALLALPETVKSLNRSVKALSSVARDAQATATRIDAITKRIDGLLSELDAPLRALAPGLQRVAGILDQPFVDTVPDLISRLDVEAMPVLKRLTDTEAHVAAIAASTDRIMKLVDDAQRRMLDLPGARLMAKRRDKKDADSGRES